MQIIKLSATESTNTFLQGLMRKENLPDFTVVVTENQTKGRGQREASWESEKGNNLTFSVLKKHLELKTEYQFLISICVSLAVHSLLIELNLPRVKIKWPNDILSGTLKVCGILIENVLNGKEVKSSVIGIGLNVNQTVFPDQLRATSIKKELKQELPLEPLLEKLVEKLQFFLSQVKVANELQLIAKYEELLFRKDVASTFQKPDGTIFSGIISGVTPNGKLKVKLEDDTSVKFGLKEVKLLF